MPDRLTIIDSVIPVLRLALQVGDRIPDSVQEDAVSAVTGATGDGGPVSLGPLYEALIDGGVDADHSAALILYLARLSDVLGAELVVPPDVADRSGRDQRTVLDRFVEEVALLRKARPTDGETRALSETHEVTESLDLSRLPVLAMQEVAGLLEVVGRRAGRFHRLDDDQPTVIGRADTSSLHVDDEGVSWEHARVTPRAGGYVITDEGSRNGLVVNGLGIDEHALEDGDRIQIGPGCVLKFIVVDEDEAALHTSLGTGPGRDSMLGVWNRSAILARLDAECAHFRRHGRPLCLLRIDFDRFSDVNASRGAREADSILKDLTRTLAGGLRAEDEFGRLSGQELLAVLRDTDGKGGRVVAERVRQAADSFRVSGLPPVDLSVSIGLVQAKGGVLDEPEALLTRAGDLVRRAKVKGRNRVEAG